MPFPFKDILVIDDLDSSSSEAADIEDEFDGLETEETSVEISDFINRYFESSKDRIELIKSFFDAAEEIIKSSNRYNLIIFDLNMNKGFIALPQRKLQMDKIFEDYNIALHCSDKKFDANDGFNGIYLYLLLLSKGFPSERMLILTGNGSGTQAINKGIKEKCNSLCIKESLIHNKGTKLDIDKQFFSDIADGKKANEYYRVRRLVFHACTYWRDWLKEIEAKFDNPNKKISFNSVYGLKSDSAVSVSEFLDLLEHVEMLFPVLRPDKPEKVYYQAAKSICSFHESTAKFTDVDNKLRMYHSVPRTFRNWSAHNKFENSSMTAEEFALLFCITLRTYFDDTQNSKKSFNDKVIEYEEDFYHENNIKCSSVEFKTEFKNILTGSISDITNKITIWTIYNIYNPCKFWDLIIKYGDDRNSDIPTVNYVLYPLLFSEIEIDYPLAGNSKAKKLKTINPKSIDDNIYQHNTEKVAENECKQLLCTDNSVQTLFLRQAFNIIRKHYPGKA